MPVHTNGQSAEKPFTNITDKIMRPRKHQLEGMHIVDEIAAGVDIRDVVALVTPGGGKSYLPVIFGKLITLGFADAICWICPRLPLQYQGESNFQDPFGRKLFGHSLSIRASTNEIDPCRGLDGFVTTYQAIGLDALQSILTEIRSKRYVLILDEFHHAEEDSLWEGALKPIYEAAKYRIKMTGTIERNSGKKVAFTDYAKTYRGLQPSLESERGRVIIYSRQDALYERAIIPLHFTFNDAEVEWTEEDTGETKKYDSLANVLPKDVGKSIWTAINTDYAKELINKALDHWTEHRKINPDAKMLIVAANIANAKEALGYLRERFRYADIATSFETNEAHQAIKRFKEGKTHILSTVAMAYEGLDVPAVSHIVSLTNYRSVSWIEQMFARAVRVNPSLPYRQQYGYIFCMDDPRTHEIVSQIKSEQLPIIKVDRPAVEQLDLFSTENQEGCKPYNIDPVGSQLTNWRTLTLGEHWPVNDQEIEYQEKAAPETPTEKEHRLRSQIGGVVNMFCRVYKYDHANANTEIKKHFNKGRSRMTIPELETCLAHVRGKYVVNGIHRRVIPREAKRYYGNSASERSLSP